MAYRYSTRLSNILVDAIILDMEKGALPPSLRILGVGGETLVTLPFESPLVKNRDAFSVELSNPTTSLAVKDATASSAVLLNGDGEIVVSMDVGSATSNPEAELILSSTLIYKGGTVIVTSVKLLI